MPMMPKTHHMPRARRQQPSAIMLGYDAVWEKLRRLVKVRDPICVVCGRRPTRDIDHILPKTQGGTDDLTNLQGLCKSCHSRKTAREVLC